MVYQITVIVYSVFLGPLSKYPGPKFAAASRIPFAIRRLQGTDIHWVHKLHLKYGDVVRIAPTEISYTDGQAWKDIYGKYDSISHGVRMGQFQKDLPFYGKPMPGFKDLIRVNDSDHARARRNLSHAFSESSLKKQDGLIRHYIDLLVEKLDEVAERGIECDIGRMLNYTTFDIMGDLSAGEDMGCLTGGAYHPQVAFIFGIFRMMPSFQEAQHFPLLANFIQFTAPKTAAKAREEHLAFAKGRVDRRLASTDPRPDIMGILTDAKEDFQLSREELYGNMRLFMTAGTETSATCLSGLTWYLLMNPDKMTILTNEIRAKFSSAAEIDNEVLAKMPYLNACIEEALRLYPPVPGGLPRLAPPGGAIICQGYVPQNVKIHYSVQHIPMANKCHRRLSTFINMPHSTLRLTSKIRTISYRKDS